MRVSFLSFSPPANCIVKRTRRVSSLDYSSRNQSRIESYVRVEPRRGRGGKSVRLLGMCLVGVTVKLLEYVLQDQSDDFVICTEIF